METTIESTAQKNIESWLQGAYDEATKTEIRRLQKENPKELNDAFYTHLSFGTGGLRGIMGVGTNRMNAYTVRAATQGLANYLKKQGENKRVIIGYDNRKNSRHFAEETAKVLAANEIEVFLYKELRPLALVSFGVLYKKCNAGVMITASHNPPKYNGYKVYWDYGGQVLPPHDRGIINEVNLITSLEMIKTTSITNPLIVEVDGEIDEAYMKAIRDLQLHPGDNHSKGHELHLVYTSLHGAGITMIPRVLDDWGFRHVTLVDPQTIPDGSFPTVQHPNPEEKEALKLGIERLESVKGDILVATDPDTDRMGVVVSHQGKSVRLNGNQTACIALEHICRSLTEKKIWPPKPMFMKTIVTTELFKAIAEHHRAQCLDVLTGFKYIGEKISQWEDEKKGEVPAHHYIFGAEESYGYLYGTHVRDKDAIICTALISEAALQCKLNGKTLVDFLYELYQQYGIYREGLRSITYEGKEGIDKMRKIMETLRHDSLERVGEVPVMAIEDYLQRHVTYLESKRTETLHLPQSDVLRYWLADRTKIVVRPSGTEPKIKLYCGCEDRHHHPDANSLEKAISVLDRKVETMMTYFERLMR